ncbi:hypothetical protein KCP70_11055 [Salmonella enterica subsp. enterica]|nr:hypothetical protein KCP70_11055 [Salmonella enterica subsp. enterica]
MTKIHHVDWRTRAKASRNDAPPYPAISDARLTGNRNTDILPETRQPPVPAIIVAVPATALDIEIYRPVHDIKRRRKSSRTSRTDTRHDRNNS